jgi:hypothetical protein
MDKKYENTHLLNIDGNTNIIASPSSSTNVSSLSSSSQELIKDLLDEPQSPPEYLNFHEECDDVDEFFLFLKMF